MSVSCADSSLVTTHSATQTQNKTPASADVDDKLFQLWVTSLQLNAILYWIFCKFCAPKVHPLLKGVGSYMK